MARAPPMRLASLTHPSTIMLRCRQIRREWAGVDWLAGDVGQAGRLAGRQSGRLWQAGRQRQGAAAVNSTTTAAALATPATASTQC